MNIYIGVLQILDKEMSAQRSLKYISKKIITTRIWTASQNLDKFNKELGHEGLIPKLLRGQSF